LGLLISRHYPPKHAANKSRIDGLPLKSPSFLLQVMLRAASEAIAAPPEKSSRRRGAA